MVGMQEMGHLMHDHVVKNPSWHVQKPVRYSNCTPVGCTASAHPSLICNEFNGIRFEPALEIPAVELIEPLPQVIIFIDLFLQLFFLDFLLHLCYDFPFFFPVHSERKMNNKSISNHPCLDGLFSACASNDFYFHSFVTFYSATGSSRRSGPALWRRRAASGGRTQLRRPQSGPIL